MPFVTIPADTWTAVVTTAEDTVFENRASGNVFLTTLPTGSLVRDEGVSLGPNGKIVVVSGKNVSAYSIGVAGRIFYMGV